jgi:hypothetical protein
MSMSHSRKLKIGIEIYFYVLGLSPFLTCYQMFFNITKYVSKDDYFPLR